jgi:hypothetical protein
MSAREAWASSARDGEQHESSSHARIMLRRISFDASCYDARAHQHESQCSALHASSVQFTSGLPSDDM